MGSIEKVRLKKFPAQRGRITLKQKQDLDSELVNYCLNGSNFTCSTLDDSSLKNIFGRTSKLIIDIGFGNGEQLLQLSEEMPWYDFIGIELYKKGIANLIGQLKNRPLKNIKIIHGEAQETLQQYFSDRSIHKIQIFFPDPWPKRKHHKRRLIQPDFIAIVKRKLAIDGIIHIATDSNDYAKQILKVMSQAKEFDQVKNTTSFIARPTTKFELRGKSLGHSIWDLVFVLKF